MEPIPAMYMNVLKRLWIFMKKGVPPQLISQYFSIAGYRNTPRHNFYIKQGGIFFRNKAALSLDFNPSMQQLGQNVLPVFDSLVFF